jgi:hypothetical protein
LYNLDPDLGGKFNAEPDLKHGLQLIRNDCRRTELELYQNLEHQCRMMDIPFIEELPSLDAFNTEYDLIGRQNSSSIFQILP